MKSAVSILALTLVSTTSLASSSEDNKQPEKNDYYVKGGISYSMPNDLTVSGTDFFTTENDGIGFSLAAGMFINDNFALEAEVQHKIFGFDSGGFKSISTSVDGNLTYTTGFFNGYYYPLSDSKTWNPSIGLGIGLSRVEFDDFGNGSANSVSDSDTVFAYHVMLGNRFKVSNDFYIDTEYRYFATNDFSITGNGDTAKLTNSDNHTFMISLVIPF